MTTTTSHGQVPEALIDLIDAYAETRHRCGRIYNAKTAAARNAVIEALSGVQALSAAPVVPRMSAAEVNNLPAHVHAKWGTQPQAGAVPQGWKAVPVNPTPEMWKAAKSVPDPNPPYPPHYGLVWDAMLAATPTPPAEQQAAPKAAPGVGNSGFDYKTAADFLNGKTVSDEAVRKFVAASRWAHDERASLSATLLAMHGVLTSREAEIALLKKALLEAETATQQEAQEPAPSAAVFGLRLVPVEPTDQMVQAAHHIDLSYMPGQEGADRAAIYRAMIAAAPQPAPATQQAGDVVAYLDVGAGGYLDLGSELSEDALQQLPKGRHALVIAGTYGIDGYVAAPQPAPAPLSDDTERLEWLLWKLPGDALRYVVGELADTSSGSEFRAAIDAAIAAQGGKA